MFCWRAASAANESVLRFFISERCCVIFVVDNMRNLLRFPSLYRRNSHCDCNCRRSAERRRPRSPGGQPKGSLANLLHIAAVLTDTQTVTPDTVRPNPRPSQWQHSSRKATSQREKSWNTREISTPTESPALNFENVNVWTSRCTTV